MQTTPNTKKHGYPEKDGYHYKKTQRFITLSIIFNREIYKVKSKKPPHKQSACTLSRSQNHTQAKNCLTNCCSTYFIKLTRQH
jgi:hypothetical protein